MKLQDSRLPAPANATERHLQMLGAFAPPHGLFDVRYRLRGGGLAQIFLDVRAVDAASMILRIGESTDVYVGCAVRVRRRGRREDIAPTALLWVDCDGPEAFAALLAFRPAASAIIASGSENCAHAFWALTRSLGVEELERCNRQLAAALGADARCADAARVLRVPGTRNFKALPPRPVEQVRHTGARHHPQEIVGALPPAPPPPGRASTERLLSGDRSDPLLRIEPTSYVRVLTGRQPTRGGKVRCPFHALSVGRAPAVDVSAACSRADASLTDRGDDLLRLVPPPVYFERLTGLRVGRSGKLRCLFHDDRSPSLHVYQEPERGWYCFGCGRGGSIYDLAALLSGRGTRGRDFVELRRWLKEFMFPLNPSRGGRGSAGGTGHSHGTRAA